jgi:DNA-binding MarR family transcriptional regulator
MPENSIEFVVSTRYYRFMLEQSPTPQQTVAELVEQLGHCACSEAFSAGLNPAQWAALRYFERANRFSRTVSAFAHYHGTTRGTASQTIRALVQKGFLRRLPAKHDQRSFRLALTDRARTMLASDPFAGFVSAAGSLGPAQCAILAKGLRAMLEQVQDRRARRSFGVCTSCRHLLALDGDGKSGCGNRCVFKNELLQDGELGRICIDYESRTDH